jgi:YfiH family protein
MLTAVHQVGACTYRVGMTDRTVGDMSPAGGIGTQALESRRASVSPHPWIWSSLRHGRHVIDADATPDSAAAPEPADAVVTGRTGATIAVHIADCLGIALLSANGTHAVVHAGWRGMLAGVVEAAVKRVRSEEGAPVSAVLSPGIGAPAYEFLGAEKETLADRYGPDAVGVTRWGTPALDVRAAARAALAAAEVTVIGDWDLCTAENAAAFFSHRARRETERMAFFVSRLQ